MTNLPIIFFKLLPLKLGFYLCRNSLIKQYKNINAVKNICGIDIQWVYSKFIISVKTPIKFINISKLGNIKSIKLINLYQALITYSDGSAKALNYKMSDRLHKLIIEDTSETFSFFIENNKKIILKYSDRGLKLMQK